MRRENTVLIAGGRSHAAFLFALAVAVFGLACGAGSQDERTGERAGEPTGELHPRASESGESDEHDDHAVVSFTTSEIEEFELRMAPAGKATVERLIELPGVVRANEDRLAHIVPRFAGIVIEVRRHIGDAVKSGETLALIESSHSLSAYALKTLLAGVIIEKHVTRGEAVTPDSQAFVVADLESVWIDLSIYQRDLNRIHPGQPARVIAGHDLPEAEGVISYVTPVVDETTRTATARIVLDNPDGFWRPGMFASALVTVERAEVEIAVPVSALHMLDDATVVFVANGTEFRPRPVTVGRRDPQWAEIRSGLAAGESIVVDGGFTLKSELLRSEFGGGHAH
jgi:cobalt-zinc-cadmium efflux system membrane fusion protein